VSDSATAPSLRRRLASMLYEAILLFAVAFLGTWLFQLFAGTIDITGWRRHALQTFLVTVFAIYFVWSWLRGGQTLAMKTWRIRVVDITPEKAILRFLYALVFVPTGVSIVFALIRRDGQFLHDRLAGTRLISVQ
jgi:uncharacterized RDD family membrane protein YckC